jgi:hypothetical protein
MDFWLLVIDAPELGIWLLEKMLFFDVAS